MTNIAKLLKDCPKGTKLYSPLFGEVELIGVNNDSTKIRVIYNQCFPKDFLSDGRYLDFPDAECLLFPDERKTWEGWKLPVQPKFKVGTWITDGNITVQIEDIRNNSYIYSDGVLYSTRTVDKVYHLWTIADSKDSDVLCTYEGGNPKIVFILRGKPEGNCSVLSYYFYYNIMYPHFEPNAERGCLAPKRENVKPATKEQRNLLFAKIKEAGYQWDTNKKELRKIQPHYDISNFKPFDKVLIRDRNGLKWTADLFSYIDDAFVCTGGVSCRQCIPYNDDTKHLLGTTDMCDEMYINW